VDGSDPFLFHRGMYGTINMLVVGCTQRVLSLLKFIGRPNRRHL